MEWKLTFSSPVATAEFSKWVQHIECRTLTASSFWIWNSSVGIPSHPLALIIVMLPQAHLTLHSRMSGSRWLITPSRLSGSLRSFFFFCSILLCILAISYPSIISVPFLSLIVTIFALNIPLVSLIFLKRPLVFAILCFPLFRCFDHFGRLFHLSLLFVGTLHSGRCIFLFLLCLSLLFSTVCKVSLYSVTNLHL